MNLWKGIDVKILFIVPGGYIKYPRMFNRVVHFNNLTTPYLAALTPEDIEIEIIDEMVQKLDLSRRADLVAGLTTFTYSAKRVYKICEEYRKRGVPTILGGMHVSFEPEEASRYADSVVIGEAESVWPQVIEDLRVGKLQKVYHSTPLPSLEGLPIPRRGLLYSKILIPINVVQTARGCKNRCVFCQPAKFYGKMRHRPAEDIIAEIPHISGRFIIFADETFSMHPEVERIMEALKKNGKRWGAQMVTSTAARDLPLLMKAKDCGCFGTFLGLDSLSAESLKASGKGHNKIDEYAQAVENVHSCGMGVWGSFILGLDHDTPEIFETTVNFAIDAGIDLASFSPFTPLPGTDAFVKIKSEGRLLTTDWQKYDFKHVVFRPKRMTPEELLAGLSLCSKRFYSPRGTLKRALRIQQKHLLWPTSMFMLARQFPLFPRYSA